LEYDAQAYEDDIFRCAAVVGHDGGPPPCRRDHRRDEGSEMASSLGVMTSLARLQGALILLLLTTVVAAGNCTNTIVRKEWYAAPQASGHHFFCPF
jgi:hypothetical protein